MDILTPVLEVLDKANREFVREIADATGVPAGTIIKIKYRRTVDPRVRAVERVYSYLFEHPLGPRLGPPELPHG